jgi:hypothetical protein
MGLPKYHPYGVCLIYTFISSTTIMSPLLGLPKFRPYEATKILPLRGYQNITPTGFVYFIYSFLPKISPLLGLPKYHPYGVCLFYIFISTKISPLLGLPKYRPYGVLNIETPNFYHSQLKNNHSQLIPLHSPLTISSPFHSPFTIHH